LGEATKLRNRLIAVIFSEPQARTRSVSDEESSGVKLKIRGWLYRQVSTIVFYDRNYRILLQNRKGISKFGEEWGFFGGSIEDEESPAEALMREVMEELEYKITNFKFFKSYSAILPGNIRAIEYKKKGTLVNYLTLKRQKN